MIVFILMIYAAALFGPPPPSASMVHGATWPMAGRGAGGLGDSHRRTDST